MAILKRIVEYARTVSTAGTEAESDYNGLLSWSGEWHAVEVGLPLGILTALALYFAPPLVEPLLGIYVGMLAEGLRRGAPTNELSISKGLLWQIRKEVHYYLGSWAAGFAPTLAVIVAVTGWMPPVTGWTLPIL